MKITIPLQEVTLGDLVEVTSGEGLPADIRLIYAQNFKVDLKFWLKYTYVHRCLIYVILF